VIGLPEAAQPCVPDSKLYWAESVAPQRLSTLLLGIFAAVALVLAAVGIYGVISYGTTQRTREIGIRIAVGASANDVLGMFVAQGLRLGFIGVAAGALTAAALTRVLSSFSRLLYGVGKSDPLTFLAVSACVLAASLLACYVPARRAAHSDPMAALRHE